MPTVLHALFGKPSHASHTHTMAALGDWELVQRVRDEDPRAAEAFFDRFVGDVERVVCKTLPYPSSWDDAVSETFARAWSKLGTLLPNDKVRAWMLGVAANVAREQRRAARRPHWQPELDEGAAPVSIAPGASVEAREAVHAVFEICARMSESDADLVLLRWLSTLELTELAELRGVSLATLKRHLVRAEHIFFEMAAADARLEAWSNAMTQRKETP